MRILHTSDWHLGRTLHGVDLTDAHQAFLDHLVEVVREEGVDAVVVAGDVYDRAHAPVDAVNQLGAALRRLTELAPVVVTSGNHDSAPRLGFGADLYRDRLIVRTRPQDIPKAITLPNAAGGEGLYIYALPYLEPNMVRHDLSEERDEEGARVPLDRTHEAVVGAAMRQVTRDLGRRRASSAHRVPTVVMAHAFVVGGVASESERDIRVGGVDSVPSGIFCAAGTPDRGTHDRGAAAVDAAAVDYVALGHLHGPQRVGAADGPGPRIRYSGSPIAFSFSEMHHAKASTLVEFDEIGRVASTRQILTPVPRSLSEVRGTLDEVLSRRFEDQQQDWVRVVVHGDARPEQLVARVKQAFPHALEVTFEHEGGLRALTGISRAAADPLDVIAEFVTQVRNTPPGEDERAVLRLAYERLTAQERSA